MLKSRERRDISQEEALALAGIDDLDRLMAAAADSRDTAHPQVITYSPKVFIPLTQLCRDVCHYCTFARTPRKLESPFLTRDQVLDIARKGREAGCHEALFTLGDKPELRYAVAREALQALGHADTISYLAEMAEMVFEETGLLPHVNAGLMGKDDLGRLRAVSVSQGLMLESSSHRLLERGGPHFGSPDKDPDARLAMIETAGELAVPFTSGILIGIGETRRERIEALLALRDTHRRHGHLQEIIIQNFRRKPGTVMAAAPEPSLEDLLWTVAIARLVLGPDANIQAPPNLSPGGLEAIIAAGINDWGGVSPVTPDHVNPEAPWPEVQRLRAASERAGKTLLPRLAIYPEYVTGRSEWVNHCFETALLRLTDSSGFPRTEEWAPGAPGDLPDLSVRSDAAGPFRQSRLFTVANRALGGKTLTENEIVELFEARGRDTAVVCEAADELRAETCGDAVSYIITRNINYTNICGFNCGFCAFSKKGGPKRLREAAYDMPLEEIQSRATQARRRGALEVCLQGGIHPRFTGQTYIDICRAIKAAEPGLHIHAFSPLEVRQGAETLGVPVREMLERLKDAGLGSLPGTAAEILDDEVRQIICPDKLNTAEWLEVVEAAHDLGLTTTATIMFGHVDRPVNWARHLLRLKRLQARTGGFTEFVPLPFVHMQAPIYRQGRSRRGPTFREAVLMHAVSRLVLHPHITNIQTSWTKMGREGAAVCLNAGVNDMGGTLMNESISRAAGASHGQEMTPTAMEAMIRQAGRTPWLRTNGYQQAPPRALAVASL